MIRRGFLRSLGGLAALAPSLKPGNAITSPLASLRANAGPLDISSGDGGGIFTKDPDSKAKWNLFETLAEPTKRRQRRTARMLALTGGWPPGIACMESNALWFRAHSAEKWIERRSSEDRGILDEIHQRIYGEKYYD